MPPDFRLLASSKTSRQTLAQIFLARLSAISRANWLSFLSAVLKREQRRQKGQRVDPNSPSDG